MPSSSLLLVARGCNNHQTRSQSTRRWHGRSCSFFLCHEENSFLFLLRPCQPRLLRLITRLLVPEIRQRHYQIYLLLKSVKNQRRGQQKEERALERVRRIFLSGHYQEGDSMVIMVSTTCRSHINQNQQQAEKRRMEEGYWRWGPSGEEKQTGEANRRSRKERLRQQAVTIIIGRS